MDKSRITTGVVVLAAAAAVVLSVFAVNRSGQPTDTAASVSSVSSSSAPVTTGPAEASSSASAAPTTTRPTTTAPTTTAPATTAPVTTSPEPMAAAPAPTASATYTVQPGDNLTVIAAWFKLNGYGDLYEANKAVIGANPDLIYPGQTITLTSAGVSMGG